MTIYILNLKLKSPYNIINYLKLTYLFETILIKIKNFPALSDIYSNIF